MTKKEREFTDKVIQERASEIDTALEEKKKFYESFPSVLDSKDFPEPNPETESPEDFTEWWQILGLRTDPFPRQDGLNKMPEEIYEKVIYKNELIQTYSQRVQSNRDKILNKGTMILGNFGTGKTTFFDYLSYILIQNKICPIRINFGLWGTEVEYYKEFETKLYILLRKFYVDRCSEFYNGPPNLENSKNIMLELKKKGWAFVVMMDNLHKHVGYEDTILRFLSALQNAKDDLIRSEIGVGFFVAGLPSWELKMKRDGALAGFFDTSPERILEVSPEDAYEVINKRLNAFSTTPRKRIISPEWIRQIHRQLKHEGTFVNYRMLIDEVVKELKNKNFNILETNFVNVSEETIGQISSEFKTTGLSDLFNNLLFRQGIGKEENKIYALELLVRIYNAKGIEELDPEFITAHFFFKRLGESRLIKKLVGALQGFKWVIEPSLSKFFDEIYTSFSLYPEDYLKKLFFVSKVSTQKPSKSLQIFDEIENLVAEYSSKIKDHLFFRLIVESVSLYKRYDEVSKEAFDSQKFENNANLLVASLVLLSRAIFSFSESFAPKGNDKETLESWSNMWYNPDTVFTFISERWYKRAEPSREQAEYLYLSFREAYLDLFNFLKELIVLNAVFPIPYKRLNANEISVFSKIRKDLSESPNSDTIFRSIKNLNILVEEKLRKTFFNHFKIIYGSIHNRLNQLDVLKQKLEKIGIRYDSPFFNEFQNLDRGEYKQIVLNNSKLKRQYFKHLYEKWTESDLESFFTTFCKTDIITSHSKIQEINQYDYGYVFRYIINAMDLLALFNTFYFDLLQKHFYFIIETDGTISCYFSVPGLKEEIEPCCKLTDAKLLQNYKELQKIVITSEELDRVYNKLEQYSVKTGSVRVNLEDLEAIYSLFSVEYEKFMAILALLYYRSKTKNDEKYKFIIEPLFGVEFCLITRK